MGKNYYVQVFLEKCRYVVKENKRTKKRKISMDKSDEKASDKE